LGVKPKIPVHKNALPGNEYGLPGKFIFIPPLRQVDLYAVHRRTNLFPKP
jgi:hypothetical protein